MTETTPRGQLSDDWCIDSAKLSERFPIYTRFNANDVLPEPISPLGADLIWQPHILPGFSNAYAEMGAISVAEANLDPDAFPAACFRYGHMYVNVTTARLTGIRSGLGWEAIDASFFGSHPDAPPHETHPTDGDPETSARLAARTGWTLTTSSFPELEEDTRIADRLRVAAPGLRRDVERGARGLRPQPRALRADDVAWRAHRRRPGSHRARRHRLRAAPGCRHLAVRPGRPRGRRRVGSPVVRAVGPVPHRARRLRPQRAVRRRRRGHGALAQGPPPRLPPEVRGVPARVRLPRPLRVGPRCGLVGDATGAAPRADRPHAPPRRLAVPGRSPGRGHAGRRAGGRQRHGQPCRQRRGARHPPDGPGLGAPLRRLARARQEQLHQGDQRGARGAAGDGPASGQRGSPRPPAADLHGPRRRARPPRPPARSRRPGPSRSASWTGRSTPASRCRCSWTPASPASRSPS